MKVEDEKMKGLYVMKLVRSFCTSSYDRNGVLVSLLYIKVFRISLRVRNFQVSLLIFMLAFCLANEPSCVAFLLLQSMSVKACVKTWLDNQ